MGSHFFDGASPKRYDAALEIWPEGISFQTERGTVDWRYEELIRLWDYRPTAHLAFTHTKHQDSRLIVEEPEAIAEIARHAPQLTDRRRERVRTFALGGIVTAGVALFIAATYFVVPPVVDSLARTLPWSLEENSAVDEALIERFAGKRCVAEEPQAIMLGLAERLAATSGFPHPIRFEVRSSKMTNAFALPGGRILILNGLLQNAGSPNELAAVLGHEIGHVVNRDHTERWMRNNLLSGLSMLLFGGDTTGSIGETLFQTGLSLSYSRRDESDADDFAIGLLNELDLNPRGGAAFFERLAGKGGFENALPTYLSTHPASGDRAEFFHENGTGTGQALTPADWLILKRICDETG